MPKSRTDMPFRKSRFRFLVSRTQETEKGFRNPTGGLIFEEKPDFCAAFVAPQPWGPATARCAGFGPDGSLWMSGPQPDGWAGFPRTDGGAGGTEAALLRLDGQGNFRQLVVEAREHVLGDVQFLR